MSYQLTIEKASVLPQEEQYLASVIADLTDSSSLQVYADWLEDQGDEKRASFVRQYVESLQSGENFPNAEGYANPWLSVIGFRLAKACCENDLAAERHELLRLALPALKFSESPPDDDDDLDFGGEPLEDTFPIGATKRFGLPDLPSGSKWPQQKDCNTLYDPDSGIDPETHCGFLAQINCEDLQGTLLGTMFPEKGLLSFFACGEFDEIGMYDGYVTFTPDPSTLERLEIPESLTDGDDEANMVVPPQNFVFEECIEFPGADEGSPFQQLQWNYDDPRSDAHQEVREIVEQDSLNSLGGYTQSTSSDDPLPGTEWCKLLGIGNMFESRFHFCIRKEALKAADFSGVKLAWIDFD